MYHALAVRRDGLPTHRDDDVSPVLTPAAVVQQGREGGGQHRPPLVTDGGGVQGEVAELCGKLRVRPSKSVRRRGQCSDDRSVARTCGRDQLSGGSERALAGLEKDFDRL